MILGYIDESGINYSKDKNGYYSMDGPYAIWTCVLITEKKYFHLEREVQDLAKRYLGRNIQKNELHATDIWESRKTGKDQNEKVRQYFEELIQLTSKFRIPVLFGIQQKNPKFRTNNIHGVEKELEKARYSLLSVIEHKLAKINETAILVSDEDGTAEALKNLVFQRTKWRYSPPMREKYGVIRPKYLFEFQSNFILDQLHYVNSADSILMQFVDHICFVLRKVLEHLYLLNYPQPGRPTADKSYIPITADTFNAFMEFCEIMYGNYSDDIKDVRMGDLNQIDGIYFQFDSQGGKMHTFGPTQTDARRALSGFTPYG